MNYIWFRLLSHDALALLLCAVVAKGGCHHAKANGTLWTIPPDGELVLVVLAHRAHAVAMTEDNPSPVMEQTA